MAESYIVFLHGTSLEQTHSCALRLREDLSEAQFFAFLPEAQCSGREDSLYISVPLPEGATWREAANALLPRLFNEFPDALLLLWDTSFSLQTGSICALQKSLSAEHIMAAAPLWLRTDHADLQSYRVLNAGLAADSQGLLHVLYEGISKDHPLAKRPRFFQLAFDCVLLLRLKDCINVGGFSTILDEELASLNLTLTLHGQYNAFVALSPDVQVLKEDPFFSFALLGLWNSHQQRGRIPPGLLDPDYQNLLAADGLSLRVDSWLHEGPGDFPDAFFSDDQWENAWQHFCLFPNPDTLIEFFRYAQEDEEKRIVQLCQGYPYYLPKTRNWYISLASRQLHFAKKASCAKLLEDLQIWEENSSYFYTKTLPSAMEALRNHGVYEACYDFAASAYDAWQELVEPTLPSVATIEVGLSFPAFSVLMPIYNPNPEYLIAAVESLRAQKYQKWQLCMADDASTVHGTQDLLHTLLDSDARICCTFRNENGHISKASNSALELAKAPYCCFMDQDDLLAPTALEESAKTFVTHSTFQYVFSDQDFIDSFGVRRTPVFKCDYDWYMQGVGGHLSSFSTSLLRDIGGLRVGFEGAQDYDLSLRVSERIGKSAIGHIPRILYHWRIHPESTAGFLGAKPYAIEAHNRALLASARRKGCTAELCDVFKKRFYRLLLHPDARKNVSVIYLVASAKIAPEQIKILANFGPSLKEVLWLPIVEGARPPRMLSAFLRGHCPTASLQSLPYMSCSWQKACTEAAAHASSETLLFLSASLLPKNACRPEQLAFLAQQKDVSLVSGAVYQGDLIWDLGAFPDASGQPFALARGFTSSDLLNVLTAKMLFTHRSLGGMGKVVCTALSRTPFLEAGGFAEEMGDFAQIDYVLRQEKKGCIALTSPWGAFEEREILNAEDAGEIATHAFSAAWQKELSTHLLRHPLLHAADDKGWALLL